MSYVNCKDSGNRIQNSAEAELKDVLSQLNPEFLVLNPKK